MIKRGMMIRRAVQSIAKEMENYNFSLNLCCMKQDKTYLNDMRKVLEFVTGITTWYQVSNETGAFEYLVVQYRTDNRVIMYVKNLETYEHYTIVEKYEAEFVAEVEHLQKLYGDENVIEVI